MKDAVVWVRASYWIGAVVDGIAALLLFFPGYLARLNDATFHWPPTPSPALQSLRFSLATLILSWTILLLWADRKPIERKGVLLLTVCPLVTFLVGHRIYALAGGHGATSLPATLLQMGLLAFFGFGYFRGGRRALSKK